MEQLYLLLFLSFSMLVGSFLSGTVPMAFKLSDSKSRLLALMGSGILVGTALAIIIPEGIDSIYAQPIPISVAAAAADTQGSITDDHLKPPIIPSQEPPVDTWIIGVSLVAGFVLMLLIDQFSIYQTTGDESHNDHRSINSHQHEYSLANQEEDDDVEDVIFDGDKMTSDVDNNSETTSETKPIRKIDTHRVSMLGVDDNLPHSNNVKSLRNQIKHQIGGRSKNTKVTPTLGLVIHAAADGIALGAAATTSHRDVEMIIFLAIMLHKAPAAFSLVVFLLHRGLEHSTIRRHLLAFSLSAPLAALVTYFGLSQSGKEALRRNNATGIAMLFSAGTFLYVATVHVLPELVHNKLLTPKELLFLVGGAFLPILLAQSI